jgi:activator of 2-hydroxyglutaryl-CoA dehydratase
VGFLAALREVAAEKPAATQPELEIVAHPESVLAGALGAALLAAHRHRQLEEMGRLVTIAA